MYLKFVFVAVMFVLSQALSDRGVGHRRWADSRISESIIISNCSFKEHTINCTQCNLVDIPLYHDVYNNITIFDLHLNTITALKNNSFNATPNVLEINLMFNLLADGNIQRDAFAGLNRLQRLSLGRNQLTFVGGYWFHTLPSLEVLSFANSKIKHLSADALNGCWQLKDVHFEDNNLVNLPDTIFHNLPHLRRVFIHINSIRRLPGNMFKNSTSVEVLSFENNQIETVFETSELQGLQNLQNLSISGNPYRCDCEILWFSRWMNDPGNVTFLSTENATCREDATKIENVARQLKHCDLNITAIIVTTCSLLLLVVLASGVVYTFRWNIRYLNQLRLRRKQYERIKNERVDRDEFKYDAFVSYESNDLDWVLKTLHPTLESPPCDFRLCLDYRDFIAGDSVVNNITDAVKLSRKVIVVVTENYARSEWCYFELEMARLRMMEKQEDAMIFILLSNVSPESMSVLLKKEMVSDRCINWPSCEEGKKVFWVKLVMALRSPNVRCNRARTITI